MIGPVTVLSSGTRTLPCAVRNTFILCGADGPMIDRMLRDFARICRGWRVLSEDTDFEWSDPAAVSL